MTLKFDFIFIVLSETNFWNDKNAGRKGTLWYEIASVCNINLIRRDSTNKQQVEILIKEHFSKKREKKNWKQWEKKNWKVSTLMCVFKDSNQQRFTFWGISTIARLVRVARRSSVCIRLIQWLFFFSRKPVSASLNFLFNYAKFAGSTKDERNIWARTYLNILKWKSGSFEWTLYGCELTLFMAEIFRTQKITIMWWT